MKSLEQLLSTNPLPSWRPAAWFIMGLLAFGIIWANFAQLDEVATAEGEVVPFGQVKAIQHLEGGIIIELPIREGQTVKAGDPLMLLELAATAINPHELQVRIDSLTLTKHRLQAETGDAPLEFPKEEAERRPQFVAAEVATYKARAKELESTLAVLGEQIIQRQQTVRELQARANSLVKNIGVQRKKFKISSGLVKEGLTSQLDHLNTETELRTAEGELASLREAIPGAQSGLAEANNRIEETNDSFKREALDQLNQVEVDIARNMELQSKSNDQQFRTTIRSPIDGIIKNLRHHTIGGVVQPGEVVMELVPSLDKLIIETKLTPIDRGYVIEGQDAVVKISTYDYALFGGLDGKVTHVAPDSTVTPEGITYFRVVVETDKSWLGDLEGQYPIKPGMPATVDIHTGERSVMFYLLKPVLKIKNEAFRER